MKNLKNVLAVTFLFIGLQNFAQNYNSDGIYTTKFGNISVTTEYSPEFPDGNITYGDYRENGTITGSIVGSTNSEEFKGDFFNGSSDGKFLFRPFKSGSVLKSSFKNTVEKFIGYWGYKSVNPLSYDEADRWDAERIKTGVANVKNVTNVWSGKWNTTDGAMHLSQTNKNITGRYKGLGTVTATYNPSTRLLKGTFLNQNNNKTGYIEFYFEGNTFKGKWGWNAAMTEGNWDGTKDVKNNKELSKMVASSNTNSNNSNPNKIVKYRINLSEIHAPYFLGGIASNPLLNLYGFVGVRFYRVTNSGKAEIKSFGNKPFYFFEKDEDHAFAENREAILMPDTPANYRDFEFMESEINNPDVDIEVELWHHLKGKKPGTNADYGKTRQTLTLERLIEVQKVKNEIHIGSSCSNGIKNSADQSFATFILQKL